MIYIYIIVYGTWYIVYCFLVLGWMQSELRGQGTPRVSASAGSTRGGCSLVSAGVLPLNVGEMSTSQQNRHYIHPSKPSLTFCLLLLWSSSRLYVTLLLGRAPSQHFPSIYVKRPSVKEWLSLAEIGLHRDTLASRQ